MKHHPSRRRFLRDSIQISSGLAAVLYAGHGQSKISNSPNEKLNIAAIGVGNKGKHNIDQIINENWVAFCDVDTTFLDACKMEFPGAAQYRDFRKMFDEMAGKIDAVVVSTADHTHAPATSIALSLDKHVYCEKPLTHTVAEARTISKLAAKHKVATQMGIQIHAEPNYRRVVELVRSGAIGEVNEVYTWCNKGWSDGRFNETPDKLPANLDWDLWLGPARQRPYCENVHPANWRRFWEYGSGTFGDMACHVMDLPFWALDLKSPSSINASGPELHPDGAPAWCQASYEFPREGKAPMKFHWSDGGTNFDLVKSTMDNEGRPLSDWGLGTLFVGDKGMLVADYGQNLLLPQDKFTDFNRPEPSIPDSIGHWNEWLNACKTGDPTTCNFEYACRLTESVLLGIVAFRSQKPVVWDAKSMIVKDNDLAQQFLTKEYRKGFEVVGLGRGD